MNPAEELKATVCDCDAAGVRRVLTDHLELRKTIDQPLPDYSFGQNALYAAVQRSDKATIDVLLEAGANINKRSDWWAGGFGVLDECDPSLASFLLERGAILDAHAAARLGMFDRLQALVAEDAGVVHSRGGDGQTPLHFASTIQIAEFLLASGAEMDARDVDHESTAAQYMLRVTQKRHFHNDRQDVARYLVSKGCKTDLLMAAALGDSELVLRHLDADPDCIRMSVSDAWFPKQNPHAGGSIYIWVLGLNRTAHMVARDFGHEEVFSLLMERTPPELRLGLACELGDEAAFQELLRRNPDLTRNLSEDDKRKLPNAAQGNNVEAVRLMLEAGWPVDTRGDMGATALHWAAWHGNAAMTHQILRFKPTLDLKSREYDATAWQWAEFAVHNSVHREGVDFAAVMEALSTKSEM